VFVDCDWGKKNNDVSTKYGVRGYPTVVFTDPDGKEVSRLMQRDAASVIAMIEAAAKTGK
jgi:thioredoxin-related protein